MCIQRPYEIVSSNSREDSKIAGYFQNNQTIHTSYHCHNLNIKELPVTSRFTNNYYLHYDPPEYRVSTLPTEQTKDLKDRKTSQPSTMKLRNDVLQHLFRLQRQGAPINQGARETANPIRHRVCTVAIPKIIQVSIEQRHHSKIITSTLASAMITSATR